ncbi:MAG: SDR family NAD(P)-dependent oxidoreductase [Rikenellaceae bacterium]|nr:SDR family NAD(P)-dependent oxidoreductase [Rikenellaceae bacterium]
MGRWALITGASSGIGASFSRRLAEAGWNLAMVSNRAEENCALASQLETTYGIEAKCLCLDLTLSDAAEELHRWTTEQAVVPDILISNAGMLLFGVLEKSDPEQLDRIVALHCTTPTKLCRLYGAEMAARGRGYILLVSSITAWMPYPTIGAYAATKGYLKSFGQSLWYEMRGKGVGVTTLFPSAVDTPLYDLDQKVRRRLRRFGVMLSADEVARKGLKALFAHRRRCLPGWLTKLLVAICCLLPAWALLPVLRIPAVRRIMSNEQ